MSKTAFDTLFETLSIFSFHTTAPTCTRMLLLAFGWILAAPSAGHMTDALIATSAADDYHWAAFYRLFSRATWSIDALGCLLFQLVRETFRPVRTQLAIDDTLTHHWGKHVFGACMHLDPVSSSRGHKNFVHGHCWVVCSIVVDVPWSTRPWSIPLLFRLYRGKTTGRTKPQLAREMLSVLTQNRSEALDVLVDSAYMTRELIGTLPTWITAIGAIRTNAALYSAPTANRRGRPRKRGDRMASPREMAASIHTRWSERVVSLYQARVRKEICSFVAQWYRVRGAELMRFVLVREPNGMLRVFASTHADLSCVTLLERYARRWSLEVWFRDSKQVWGLGGSRVWSEKAVLRLAPWVGLVSGLVVVWYYRARVWESSFASVQRPWYPQKSGMGMNDVLRAAQEVIRSRGIGELAAQTLGSTKSQFSQQRCTRKSTKTTETQSGTCTMAA